MPLGGGKYDDLCTAAREKAAAEAVVLIVVGGKKGHGFSVQQHATAAADGTTPLSVQANKMMELVKLLRSCADQIEMDAKRMRRQAQQVAMPPGERDD